MEEVFGSLILLGGYDSKLSQLAWGLEKIHFGTILSRSFLLRDVNFTPLLLGVWLGVDLLGALRQGCDCL